MSRSKFATAVLATAAAASALFVAGAPAVAQAQSYYGDRDAYTYDPCRRSETNRGTTGALIGGALGAVIGSNAAARNTRTEGALLGGALGAVAGASVGKNSAACERGYAPRSSYYDRPYYNDSRYGYQERPYYGGDYSAYRNRTAGRYDDDAYGRYGEAYPMAGGAVSADGCSLAESPIYLPDGRVQKRFVRVCQDDSGRYQVVD